MTRRKSAKDPERRENQMIAMAVELAEKQLEKGTASSQIISHYLKIGSEENKLKREQIRLENELLKAKKEAIKSQQRAEELYLEAIQAMKRYSGSEVANECEDTES